MLQRALHRALQFVRGVLRDSDAAKKTKKKTLTHTSIWTHLWTVEGHPEEGIVRDIARFRLHGSTIRTPT